MNRSTLFVLITLNALFVAVLAIEWVESTKAPPATSQNKTNNTDSESSLPELDLTATGEDSYSDLVERPMFIKGRKPVNEPVPETVPVAAVKKVEAFVWELSGIFTTPKGVTAFFNRTNAKVPKDNYRKYKVGQELDGWKVTEIHTDNVVLTQTNETKTLPLRKLKPKMPMQMANRMQQSQPPIPPPGQQQGIPPQNLQQQISQQRMQQQGNPSQNLQTPDVMQNNVAPESETSVEIDNTENP